MLRKKLICPLILNTFFGDFRLCFSQLYGFSLFLNNKSNFKSALHFFSKYVSFRINFFTGFSFFFLITNFDIFSKIFQLYLDFLWWRRSYRIIIMELWGLGLRFFPLKRRKWKHRARTFIFRIGLSHKVLLKEPFDLRFLKLKRRCDFRRRRFYFISNNTNLLRHLTLFLRYIKELNFYKFRGFKFQKEDIKIRIGKSLKW